MKARIMGQRRQCIVTGAARGIGFGIATSLIKEEYDLTLTVRNDESKKQLTEKLLERDIRPDRFDVIALDLSDKDEIQYFCSNFSKQIYGLINNAGVCRTLALSQMPLENVDKNGDTNNDPWDIVLKTNLNAPYLLTKCLLHRFTSPGRIVNISSQLGQEGRAGYSAYCASKFGLIGLTKVWAKELGARKITVNAICPGWVNTEMSQIDLEMLANNLEISEDQMYKNITDPLELKRYNSVDEVSDFVSFLLSEKAAGITGREMLMQTIWNQL